MSFGQPLWFCGLALLPLLLVLYVRNERRRGKLLAQLVAARLLERLAGTVSLPRRRLRFALVLLGLAALITSLAQPRYGYTWEESKRQGRDVIIAIDCSRSMLATDVAPSRLDRAKLASQDLIAQLAGDRVGLVAFAGTAFLQAPLTIDYGAVLDSLAEFNTDIIPRGGTNIAAAITEADAAFGKGESDNRCLILFTDGEELESDAVLAAVAEKDHMKIFTVGLGSADGSLIPIPGENGGTVFLKDENGQFVKSRLDEDRLRKIAESTGGFYVHLQNGPAEMQKIIRDGLGQMKEKEFDARMSRRPIERYQWPLAAALALLGASTLIGERRRKARRLPRRGPPPLPPTLPPPLPVAGVLVAVLLLSVVAQAKNSGLEAYDREDYKGAMSEFDRQLQQQRESAALNFDLGAAAYKSGAFDKALEAFSKAVTSPDPSIRAAAEYNLGNTLFQQGAEVPEAEKERRVRTWKDALQHYEQALKVAPENKDAAYNRDVVRKLLEETQKPDQQQQQQQQQNKKDDQKQDQQDQQQQQNKSQGGQKNQDQQQQKSQSQNSQSQQQQQSQSQNQQSQNASGQQQQPQVQQGKSQQPKDQNGKDGKDGQQQPQPQPDRGRGDEKKDGKPNPSQGDQQNSQQPKDGQGEQPQLAPDQSDKKRSGEIQAQNKPQPADQQQEAAAEAQAAQEGKMTEAQARRLLESLRGEDQRVPLYKPTDQKPLGRTFRDW